MSDIENVSKRKRTGVFNEKLRFRIGIFITFVLAYVITFTPFWQLIFLVGIIGGIFVTESKIGFYTGLIGVFISWTIYLIINLATSQALIIFNIIAAVIFGTTNLGFLLILIVLIIGIILGSFGGYIGASLHNFIKNRSVSLENEISE